ncbi:MAG: Rnase Y domain-containing protein, partial [Dehalococcoidales bacterium]|nr:Rnase Y domain-containing protein [Dehalococcoidales bacterium]
MALIYYIALVATCVIGVIFGGAIVFFFRRMAINRQLHIAQRKAARIVAEAGDQAKEMLREAKSEAEKAKLAAEAEQRERRSELQRQENRLSSRLESLERKLEGVDQRERNLTNKEKGLETIRTEINGLKDKELKQLETISGMTINEAKQTLLDRLESEMKEETARRLRAWEARLKEDADKKAEEILSQAIQRCA